MPDRKTKRLQRGIKTVQFDRSPGEKIPRRFQHGQRIGRRPQADIPNHEGPRGFRGASREVVLSYMQQPRLGHGPDAGMKRLAMLDGAHRARPSRHGDEFKSASIHQPVR